MYRPFKYILYPIQSTSDFTPLFDFLGVFTLFGLMGSQHPNLLLPSFHILLFIRVPSSEGRMGLSLLFCGRSKVVKVIEVEVQWPLCREPLDPNL